MRVLTVMASISIPHTFVAGLDGMNFDDDGGKMHAPHGDIACIIEVAVIAIGQIIFLKGNAGSSWSVGPPLSHPCA